MNSQVNEHYLNHVVRLSGTSEIQASEDIISGTGQKLVAKGARIDERVRDRLLAHKLLKPLEALMTVAGGDDDLLQRAAEAVMARHPFIVELCGEGRAQLHASALAQLTLTPQVDSLLRVYGALAEGKLEHAMGVALLCAGLADALPGAPVYTVELGIAALLHDVGELYIDPELLKPGARVSTQHWKHIATHPIVGARVLGDLPGAGKAVATMVLQHHERLDGFGYPRGISAADLPMQGQILATAEMLMGLLEASSTPLKHASLAVRLVPGEFSRPLIDAIVSATRRLDPSMEALVGMAAPMSDEDLAQTLKQQSDKIEAFRAVRRQIQAEITTYGKELQALLTHVLTRAERIGVAMASTGLQGFGEQELAQRLQEMSMEHRLEVQLIARELRWRVNELERQVTVRSEALPPPDARRAQALMQLSRAEPAASLAAAA